MLEEPQSVEIEGRARNGTDLLPRVRPAQRRKELPPAAEPKTLQPTRSGRSLQNGAALERRLERRSARGAQTGEKEAAEIAALKAKLERQDTLQSQWKSAQEELAAQKHAHASDATRMAEQIELLESQIQNANSNAARTLATVSKQRNVSRALAAIAGAAAWVFLCVMLSPEPRVKEAHTVLLGSPLPTDPHAALTTALDRLNDALETVPNRTPEEVLKKITAEGDGCPIVWTNDLPSVVFGKKPVRANSLAMTLEGCAEAVGRTNSKR